MTSASVAFLVPEWSPLPRAGGRRTRPRPCSVTPSRTGALTARRTTARTCAVGSTSARRTAAPTIRSPGHDDKSEGEPCRPPCPRRDGAALLSKHQRKERPAVRIS